MKTRLIILLQSTLLIISASGCMRPAYEQHNQTDSITPEQIAPIEQQAPAAPTTPTEKKNCLSWYDGCNSCSRKNGLTICTERFCQRDEYEEYKCHQWE